MKKSYTLRLYPDSMLRKKALSVRNMDETVRELINGMTEIMYSHGGIGLAAPQVGVLQRVIVADVGDGLICMANPRIIDQDGDEELVEGCLSLPEIQVNILRKHTIFVRGIDRDGKEIERDLNGLTARVIQHEIDHLNGILIIDYASIVEKLQMGTALTKLNEIKKTHNTTLF
jgi:peptide deformylase